MKLPFPAHNLSPEPIDPERLPRPSRREGPFAPNEALRSARRLFEGRVIGSESVAVAPDGTLWMLDKWGHAWIATASPTAEGGYQLSPEPVAYIGPVRPLGFHHDAAGNLVVCDTKGLLRLEKTGSSSGGGSSSWQLRCLANSAGGRPISYANDLDISPTTGKIYFTDSTCIPPALNSAQPRPWYDTMRSYMLTMYHGAPTGRLLVHDPATGTTEVLQEGLWFANGVALAPDESYVAVVETPSMRVRRRWLTGPKAGTLDTLIDGLPGFPDNINRGSDGSFWLAIVIPDVPLAHRILPSPFLRGLMARLPDWLIPKKQWGCVVKVSPEGEVLQVLMDPDGSRVSSVACAAEHDGKLWMGNLAGNYVSVLDLAQVAQSQAAAGAVRAERSSGGAGKAGVAS
ncbi:strictosidine synthase [Chlorella sorokiniana]|uniref:Strictosidine synthase n=1 Tax=Chlorella sorokiniana TaxID=3076 RepID=A0A2P6TY25_CHLSO|nr:strictosidine synthase [Chlorella sorokiniana]|eukprot:PRW58948.1 strictosidine synthase [Chlorella sorokiniana]